MLPKETRAGLTNLLRGQNAGRLSQYMMHFSSYCSSANENMRLGFADKVTGKFSGFIASFFKKGEAETTRIRTAIQNVQQSVAMVVNCLAEENGEDGMNWGFNNVDKTIDITKVPLDIMRLMMESYQEG